MLKAMGGFGYILGLCVTAMLMISSVTAQRTYDDKVYNCPLPTDCPQNTQKYLEQYGYLNPDRECIAEDIEAALRKFQEMNIHYMNVTVTGKCDTATKYLMTQKRCGCEDIVKFEKKMMPSNLIGPQEFNIGSTYWPKKHLTWTVQKYPSSAHNRRLTHQEVDDAMRRGLQIWADVSSLTFSKATSGIKADINIKFETGRHTKTQPFYDFDGPGNVLAHAFFPTSGDVHFDDDESFVLNSDQGTELYIVAAHEFGHTLGISHSNIKDALMAPYYRYSEKLQLHPDDIAAVQTMYGRNEKPDNNPVTLRPTPAPTLRPTQQPVPKDCNLRIKASFSIDSITYIFTREKVSSRSVKTFVYKVHYNSGIDFKSRTPIENMFQKKDRSAYPRAYPYRVDAAEYIPDRKQIYLFSGTRAYRYSATSIRDVYMLEEGFPKWMDVSEFPERPRAAVVLPYSGFNGYYMLIFGTTMVWDWNLYSERVGAWAYPINVFGRNMPQRVDGAYYTSQENVIRFFQGDRYYKFDVNNRRITDDTVYYVGKDFYKGQCA